MQKIESTPVVCWRKIALPTALPLPEVLTIRIPRTLERAASPPPPLLPTPAPVSCACCAALSPLRVSWLHERVARAIAFNASTTASKPSLLVVRRLTLGHAERKRAANLLGPVLAVTRPAAKRAGLSHVVHDDAALKPLWHQLATWAAATVVVAPTGAALVNLLAAPAAACVVELQPEPEGGRRGADDTYGKLARGLGLEHRRVTMSFEGERALAAASDAALRRGVDECALRRSQG